MAYSLRPRESNSPLRESVRVLGLYIRAQALIALILTVLYAIGFAIADVPWWPAIAVAGGLASVIPHFGGFVPLILAVIADLLGDRSLTQLAIMFGVWLAVDCRSVTVLADHDEHCSDRDRLALGDEDSGNFARRG